MISKNPLVALSRLFGICAKYTGPRGAPLPDGSPIQRGGTPAQQDPRDAEILSEAGAYSSVLHRLGQEPGGTLMVAVLEEWFTREGVKHQGARLQAAVEALEKRGVRPAQARPRKKKRPQDRALRQYEALLDRAITSYGALLRVA